MSSANGEADMRSHKCRRLAVEKLCIGMLLWTLDHWVLSGRVCEHCKLRTGDCKLRTAVNTRPSGKKVWQIYRPPFGIHSQVTVSNVDILGTLHITNSQATHSVMEDLLVQMGVRWFGCRGYGVSWLQER